MQFAVHESKQWHFRHLTFPNEYRVVRPQTNRGYVQVRKMIWTKNVTFFWIEFRAVLNGEWNKDKYEHQSRPPAVQYPNQFVLFGENDGYAQQWQQDQEQRGKYDQTVARMYYAKNLHDIKYKVKQWDRCFRAKTPQSIRELIILASVCVKHDGSSFHP